LISHATSFTETRVAFVGEKSPPNYKDKKLGYRKQIASRRQYSFTAYLYEIILQWVNNLQYHSIQVIGNVAIQWVIYHFYIVGGL